MNKKICSVLFIILATLPVTGCLSTLSVSDTAYFLDVNFDWADTSGCASRSPSPPITVTNIPEGTAYLKVNMVDLNNRSYFHGGGEIVYNKSGFIKQGTLKNYEGPCPQNGTHTYEITVQTINVDKSLIIGQGRASVKYTN